jgi:hypothetical protein
VTVLTPPALVAVLQSGFEPLRHPTTAPRVWPS